MNSQSPIANLVGTDRIVAQGLDTGNVYLTVRPEVWDAMEESGRQALLDEVTEGLGRIGVREELEITALCMKEFIFNRENNG